MILEELETTLRDRRGGSTYTGQLLADPELMQRKIMEEGFEVCLELARGAEDNTRVAEEVADLLYHVMVGLVASEVAFADVLAVLEGRRRS